MKGKIRIHTEVLRNLARDYDAYGEGVWQASRAACRQLELEYESLLRKYAAYPDVTSQIHEIRSCLRRTEQRVRELRERRNRAEAAPGRGRVRAPSGTGEGFDPEFAERLCENRPADMGKRGQNRTDRCREINS